MAYDRWGRLGPSGDPAMSVQSNPITPAPLVGLGARGTVSPMWGTISAVGSLAGMGVGAFHGYKRNRGSIGWAIGWSILGSLFWPVALPVMYAQGVGKPKRR